MKLLRLILPFCLLSLAPAQTQKAIDRTGLMEAVRLGGLAQDELISIIREFGVDFRLQPGDEKELVKLGATPRLIEAVKANFRGVEKPPEPAIELPGGAPLTRVQLALVLQAGVAPGVVVKLINLRGVAFAVAPPVAAEILAAGGNEQVIGAAVVNQKEAASTAPVRPAAPNSAPPPIAQADLVMLLKLRAPREKVENLVRERGVDFDATAEAGAEILASGGDSALVGLVTLNRRGGAPQRPSIAEGPALPPDRFSFQKLEPYDSAAPTGLCDLQIQVDHIVEFFVRGDEIAYEIKRGAPPVPGPSGCTQPLPNAPVAVELKKLRGRGNITLTGQPNAANGYTSRFVIEDGSGGSNLYHLRLSWKK